MKNVCNICKKSCKDKRPISFCSSLDIEFFRETIIKAIEFAVSRINYHRQLRGLPKSFPEEIEETRKYLYSKYQVK